MQNFENSAQNPQEAARQRWLAGVRNSAGIAKRSHISTQSNHYRRDGSTPQELETRLSALQLQRVAIRNGLRHPTRDPITNRVGAQDKHKEDPPAQALGDDGATERNTEHSWSSHVQPTITHGSGYFNTTARDHAKQHNGNNTINKINTAGGHSASGEGIVNIKTVNNDYTILESQRLDDNPREHRFNIDLLIVAREGQIDRIRYFIKDGVDINYSDDQGLTALHFAAAGGFKDTVKLLIEAGVDVNAESEDLGSPLCVASLCGNLDDVQALLDSRANIHIAGATVGTPLHCASYAGSLEIVRLLVQHEADPFVNGPVQLELLKYGSLLHSPFAPMVSRMCKGNLQRVIDCKPVYLSVMRGYDNLVEYFLENECSVDETYRVCFTENPENAEAIFDGSLEGSKYTECSLLMAACAQGESDIVSRLLNSYVSLHAKDTNGRSALYYAAMEGRVNCVKILLNARAILDDLDKSLTTPFFIAAYHCHVEVMEVLANWGANVDHQTSRGDTALHLAARLDNSDNLKGLKALLRLGANCTHRNMRGLTAPQIAAQKQCAKVVKCFSDRGVYLPAEGEDEITAAVQTKHRNRIGNVKLPHAARMIRIKKQSRGQIAVPYSADAISRLIHDSPDPMVDVRPTSEPLDWLSTNQKDSPPEVICIE